MIELATLCIILSPFTLSLLLKEKQQIRQLQQSTQSMLPGLSSQRSQIKPLSPAAIALGKKAYLGPRKRNKS